MKTAIPRDNQMMFIQMYLLFISLRNAIFLYMFFLFHNFYSYLNASTGSILAAVYAGANPETTPVIKEINIAVTTTPH